MHHDHPAYLYVKKRKIPEKWYSKIYFTELFQKFCNGFIPDKFAKENVDERIVIPFFDRNNVLIGFQGRAIQEDNPVRYITISLSDAPCMFGLNSYNPNLPHLVLEGPIDAMFCRNAISTAGSIGKNTKEIFNENSIFLFDNEPRAKQTCKKIQGAIDAGYKIALFPANIHEKDVNDCAKKNEAGIPDLIKYFYKTASSGLEAQMKFNNWKKV